MNIFTCFGVCWWDFCCIIVKSWDIQNRERHHAARQGCLFLFWTNLEFKDYKSTRDDPSCHYSSEGLDLLLSQAAHCACRADSPSATTTSGWCPCFWTSPSALLDAAFSPWRSLRGCVFFWNAHYILVSYKQLSDATAVLIPALLYAEPRIQNYFTWD